ncbi:MAG: cryptochrome/photolyase family protein, partial [Mariniblastus sp.]|nr:cryptochrome/photolyase family protein [Mariniblastus sp.]
ITTKPYFCGSSYIRRMSHYSAGPWCEIWDGLYWRWIHKNAEQLARNPRWAMMCRQVEKMEGATLRTHLANAERFLASLETSATAAN